MSGVPLAMGPIYPYGNPNEPILLHKGTIHVGDHFATGQIEFRLATRPAIIWQVDSRREILTGRLELTDDPHPTGTATLIGPGGRGVDGASGWADRC